MEEKEKIRYAPKIIAIVAFILTFSMLAIALTTDIVLFIEYILSFVFGIIFCAFLFVILFMLMILSCILVFGIFILENHGFWPLDWTVSTFHEILGDVIISQSQIQIFTIIRIVILVICFIAFILGILSLKMDKREIEFGYKPEGIRFKAFARLSIIFSIFGILIGIGMIALIYQV